MANEGQVLAIAGLLGGGAILTLVGLRRASSSPPPPPMPPPTGDMWGPLAPLAMDEGMEALGSPNLGAAVSVAIGALVVVFQPRVRYRGPGRDAFTSVRIVQRQNDSLVTVYGSGVAGVHVGPSRAGEVYHLVDPQQPQPPEVGDVPGGSLVMFPWPGTTVTPICGGAALPGLGTVLLEVYERRQPQDGDGFTSPTCGWDQYPRARVPVARTAYIDTVRFTEGGL